MPVQLTDANQLIEGLIVTIFKDIGPYVIFNDTKLDEGSAFNLAVKGMTTIGETVSKEVYGPFPVPQQDELRALAFVFTIKATNSEDHRILEFGRTTVFWMIYNEEKKRNIIPATGLIKSYLSVLTSRLKSEDDLTEETLIDIGQKLREMIAERVKVFGIFEKGEYQEFHDDHLLESANALLVADEDRSILYVLLLKKKLGPLTLRQINQRAEEINRENYKHALRKTEVDDPVKINKILTNYRLTKLWLREE
ncbi:MAG: hypothetical protein ACFFC7_17265 [Candidatus Hermodarchaeota archaeon]